MTGFRPSPLVLVVDDDDGMLLLMADALRAAGYRVTPAASGVQAIGLLAAERPDLMLLDLKLKDYDGMALLARIHEQGLSVPFIVVTGQGDERVAVEMMKRGALDYLMKDTAILELLPAVVRRAFAALERERSLAVAEAEQARLEREVLSISERERERIGADLHDGVGQRLTAIELMCAGLRADVAALDPKLGEQLARIMDHLRETVAQTRALARGLAPLDEQPEALQASLEQLARYATSLGTAVCRTEAMTPRPVHHRDVATQLFRIAQEAVNNAIKHSRATEIRLGLREQQGGLLLEISDNGQGFLGTQRRGMGIGIMHYRANLIGAELTIESEPGQGVAVRCLVPASP